MSLTDDFTLTLGWRYDENEKFDDNFTSRIYGVWPLRDTLALNCGVSGGYTVPALKRTDDGIVDEAEWSCVYNGETWQWVNQYVNLDEAEFQGVEATLDHRWRDLDVTANYTWSDSEITLWMMPELHAARLGEARAQAGDGPAGGTGPGGRQLFCSAAIGTQPTGAVLTPRDKAGAISSTGSIPSCTGCRVIFRAGSSVSPAR